MPLKGIKNAAFQSQAIALNNIGISMIEKKHHEEAAEVFQESLHVLLTMEEDADFSLAKLEHRVYRAQLFLSSLDMDDTPPPLVGLDNDEGSDRKCSAPGDYVSQSLDVRNQYGDSLTNSARISSSSASENFLIFYQDDKKPVDSDLLIASILHNQSQSFLAAAGEHRLLDPKWSETLMDRAEHCRYLSEVQRQRQETVKPQRNGGYSRAA